MVLPTAPTAYSTAQVLANPIELNSRLGTYTNFVNLLDLCGLALPAAMRADGIPFGITLLAPAGHDAQLASIGRVFHADTKLTMGAKGLPQPPLAPLPAGAERRRDRHRRGRRASVGHGAQRRIAGARRTTAGSDHDRAGLQALCARHHAAEARHAARRGRRGIVRSSSSCGRCRRRRSENSSPRSRRRSSIGTIRLADGRGVKGFMVEPAAIDGARDISAFGGWRAFMAEKARGLDPIPA